MKGYEQIEEFRMAEEVEQPLALKLADCFERFRSSSHRWSDGTPIHMKAAGELRRLASQFPPEPSSKQIVMMAAAILGQPEGTADNRDEAWPVAVARAERAYRALLRISHESTDRKEN